eukprot:5388207-Pleurochrysis_carterae.AAC.2
MARSATPFNWWTCGGQVDECIPRSDKKSVNSLERNSPALSLCMVPTIRMGRSAFLFARAVKEAMNLRTCADASDLLRMKYTDLKRVWSSTSTRAY